MGTKIIEYIRELISMCILILLNKIKQIQKMFISTIVLSVNGS